MVINIKRIYEPADSTDGYRILVDRLWPRGMKKETAHIDEWLKTIAPSTELRKWFNHDTTKWQEFEAKYLLELKHNEAVGHVLDELKKYKTLTLLYAAHDEQHNHALVLQKYLRAHI